MREDAVPDQPGDPAEQHASRDQVPARLAPDPLALAGAGARLDARFVGILTIGCDFGQVPSDAGSIATVEGA